MTTYYWITDDELGSISSDDPDFDPGTGWHSGTLTEYNSVVTAVPNPIHDDVHTVLDRAGVTDSLARDAFHRLFGVGH